MKFIGTVPVCWDRPCLFGLTQFIVADSVYRDRQSLLEQSRFVGTDHVCLGRHNLL